MLFLPLNMNYLAHIYLSGEDDHIKLGNFMADGVKGKKYLQYPSQVQKGILLHRGIDWFTDQNEIARISKRRLHPRYGLYKGVIIDIVYDHLLASNWDRYSDVDLQDFSRDFYSLLKSNFELLPDKVQYMSRYMMANDWLSSYASLSGIQEVLEGMNRRTGGRGHLDMAINDLEMNYVELNQDFHLFFQKLRTFCHLKLEEIERGFSN